MARIEAMTRRAYRGPLVTLTLDMGRTLSVTADHPVILHAARGETIVAAHQVKAGDKILAMSQLPIMPPLQPLDLIERLRHTPLADDVHVTCTQGSFTRLYEQFASHIARQDLRYPHEIKRHNRMPLRLFWKLEALGVLTISHQTLQLYTAGGNGARLNAVIAQDADFWRFCGYYLAEGYISQDQGRFNSIRQRIGLCFHQNEHEYIEDVRRIVEKWGLKWISRTSTNATTTIVSSRIFAWLLRDVLGCGVRSEDKRLPAGTFAAPPELRRELVRGLFSGDGAVTALQNGRNLMFEYATVSKPLSDGVALLLQTLEVVPSIRTRWMNKSKRPAYIVRVNGYQQMRLLQNTFGARHHNRIGQVLDGYQRHIRQRGFERLDNTVVLTVRGVQQESVDTTVFSMETATGTLVASSGLICHNCFPKDVRALISTGQQYGAPQRLLEATYQINEEQKQVLLPRILEHFGGDVSGKTFALWGLSFKPNTDDIREAPALILIEELVSRGARIRAYDPEAMEPAKKLVGDKVEFARRHYDACEGADALIIATEWNKFREPDFHFLKELLRQPVIFDGRNIYELDTVGNHGFTYYSIGRPIVHAA
jgi:UDPglucose 6-dehydrogenase